MITKYLQILSLSLLIIFISCTYNQNSVEPVEKISETSNAYIDSLNFALDLEFQKGHLPGFALSVFSKDTVYLTKGYGYADIDQKKPFTEHTIQNIASISKTFIAVALMNAIENGQLTLDTEINTILPFLITNPKHKNIPITVKHLATHTSSISDNGNYNKSYVFSEQLEYDKFPEVWRDHINNYNKNELMPMNNYLKKVFTEWETEDNFIDEKPGSTFEYSNIGAALLAYCVELTTKQDYRKLTTDLILNPLDMSNSGWDQQQLNEENHIIYYNEIYNAVPSYQCITYPDGGLFTTVSDLRKFMQDMMQGYEGNGKLLTSKSYQTMMTNQIPELDTGIGVIWDLDIPCCIGHGGNDFGVATLAYFDPKTGIGKILFSNISTEKEELADQFYSIFNTLFKYDSMIVKSTDNNIH